MTTEIVPERFKAFIDPVGDCWIWTRALDRYGYGRAGQQGAHRVVFVAAGGVIPPGLQLDHLCRVRSCVRPSHLEPVTRGENLRRAAAVQPWGSQADGRITHCKRGHEFTPENTYRHRTTGRRCRKCHALRERGVAR